MKRIILILTVALIGTGNLFAQRFGPGKTDKTLFSKSKRFGVFFAINSDYQLTNGLYTLETGLALNMGNGFLGIYGAGGDDLVAVDQFGDVEYLKLAHGGLWFGFSPWQDKMIHPYADFKLGVGEADIYVFDPFYGLDSKILMALNGNIGVEMNLTNWIRLNAYYGSRSIKPFFEPQFEPDKLSGGVLGVGLRIGFFGRQRGNRWHSVSNSSNSY
jgi:hypothetical protein